MDRLNLLQLAPGGHLGRFCIWTKSAVEKLEGIFGEGAGAGLLLAWARTRVPAPTGKGPAACVLGAGRPGTAALGARCWGAVEGAFRIGERRCCSPCG